MSASPRKRTLKTGKDVCQDANLELSAALSGVVDARHS